ncbi:MAG: hypothetical protein PHE97_04855 [Candidatus Omnitrophica bacterium]|nr:hypothetical protein [Candidatus Omnitrophota bacterium]
MKIYFSKHILTTGIFFAVTVFAAGVFASDIEARFKGKEHLSYSISFNGIPSGNINWGYLGKETLFGHQADVLTVSSDTKILELLNLTSKETVFIDSQTHLPLKVERNVVLFGKKESISEIYDQDKGTVRITRRNSEVKEDILQQDKPIQNILSLLYFFPQNQPLKKGKWMVFNLPTQVIKIKFVKERLLDTGSKKEETYFLIGRGAKWFNLWLDKKTRLPVRLEFILPVGKIIIKRIN